MNEDLMPREWMRGPQFASDAARAEWAPVIKAAQEAWATAELVSVSASLRPGALVFLTPEEMPTAARDTAQVGLQVTPLQLAGGQYRVAVHQPGYARAWFAAWAEGDDELIGQLLGFPKCCRAKFAEVWVERRARDQAPYCSAFAGPWETNVLLRHLGVRLVPHLPCSGDCEVSLRVARAFLEAAARAGADVASLERLLRLPATYDAVNGVAIVDCGPFRFMHGTDFVPERQVFRRAEQAAPACGNRMPAVPDPEVHYDSAAEDEVARDNGFGSRAGMDAAHEVILRARGAGAGSWVDLGAGDGALLEKLGGTRLVAVEVDPAKVERGRLRRPKVEFWAGKLQDWLAGDHGEPLDAAVVMPGRFLEMGEDERARALAGLRDASRRVLAYAYGDWVERYQGLPALAAAAGLRLTGPVAGNDQAQAAWAEVI